MAFKSVAFVNGLSYGAEDIRHLTYLASGGQSGVVTPSSFKVTATPTPSGKVVVNAGVGTATGSSLVESYLVANDQAVTIDVPPNNTSSMVYRNVIFAIRDPQMAGMPSLSGAGDIAGDLRVVGTLPSDRPYLWFGHIKLPANTATVTNEMIYDQRMMALSRSRRRQYVHVPTTVSSLTNSYAMIGGASPTFYCPPWANYANISIMVEGLEQTAAGYGRIVAAPAINGTIPSLTQEVAVTKNGPVQRHGFTSIGAHRIQTGWKGTDVQVALRGRIASGVTKMFQVDAESAMLFDVEFYESVE